MKSWNSCESVNLVQMRVPVTLVLCVQFTCQQVNQIMFGVIMYHVLKFEKCNLCGIIQDDRVLSRVDTFTCQVGGAVAQWLECATDNRVFADSNPSGAAWTFWQFSLPHFASVFQKRH